MGNHDGPKTLGGKLTVEGAKPSIVDMAEGKALQSRIGHVEPTILHEDAPYTRNDADEIALVRPIHGSDNDHHENQLVGRELEIERAVVDEWKGRGNVGPVRLERVGHKRKVERDVLEVSFGSGGWPKRHEWIKTYGESLREFNDESGVGDAGLAPLCALLQAGCQRIVWHVERKILGIVDRRK